MENTGEQALVADGCIKLDEAQRFLQVSRSTLYELMDAGELPYLRFGRNRRIPRRALIEFAQRAIVAK
jgi:excisionase family DNA binding protein